MNTQKPRLKCLPGHRHELEEKAVQMMFTPKPLSGQKWEDLINRLTPQGALKIVKSQDDPLKQLQKEPHSFEQSEFERLIDLYRPRLGFDEVMSIIARRIRLRENSDQLESNALLAIIEGRSEESDRLLDVLERRNKLGFSLVSHEPESPPRSS